MIEIKNVSKSYDGKKKALDDVSFKIDNGEIFAFIGHNGAGKTTFINAITGFEKADAKILLDGKDVYKSFEDVKYDIGFVPQMDMIRYNDNVRKTVLDAASLRLPISISDKEKNEIDFDPTQSEEFYKNLDMAIQPEEEPEKEKPRCCIFPNSLSFEKTSKILLFSNFPMFSGEIFSITQ